MVTTSEVSPWRCCQASVSRVALMGSWVAILFCVMGDGFQICNFRKTAITWRRRYPSPPFVRRRRGRSADCRTVNGPSLKIQPRL